MRGMWGSACWLPLVCSCAILAALSHPAAADFTVQERWRRGILGNVIGGEGLFVADLDGAGGQEILATGLRSVFYVMRREGSGYVQAWISNESYPLIETVRLGQLDADPALEILVGQPGRVSVYDGASHAIEKTITTPAAHVWGLRVADVDTDGQTELVFCDEATLYVYDAASGAQEYAGPYGGADLAVGNVDTDPGLEIVVGIGAGGPGHVIDGQTHAVKWSNPAGFGAFVRLGDFNGDGRQEIVAGFPYYVISVYDAALQTLVGNIDITYDLGALEVGDVEGDGLLEVVYGDRQGGSLHVHDGQTLLQKYELPNPSMGIAGIAIGDPDDDGQTEVLWTIGSITSSGDYLLVTDGVSHVLEWQSLDIEGPFQLAYGDVDADGDPEVIHACFESDAGYSHGLWFVNDAATHVFEYQSPQTPEYWVVIRRIAVANLDADPQQEVVLGTGFYDGVITTYDGLTHVQQWSTSLPDGLAVSSLAIADVDLDGALEVVAGTMVMTSAADTNHVFVLDAASGALEWQSDPLGPGYERFSLLRVANVDGDPAPEIVVSGHEFGYEGSVFVVDGVTHTLAALGEHSVTALDTPDRDGNGIAEIVIGTVYGQIQVLSVAGNVVETVASYPGTVEGLRVLDVTSDGVADYVFASGEEIQIRDGVTGQTAWSSGVLRPPDSYGEVVANSDGLLVADGPGGRREILVDLGYVGFRVYEIPAPADLSVSIADAPDPVLVGDSVVFSVAATNASAQPVDSVVVASTLGAGLSFVSSTPGPPTCTLAGQSLTCNLGSLGGGLTAGISVTAQAAAPGVISTTVSVSGAAQDPVPLNNTETETTTVTQTLEADLAMDVDDGRFVAAPGQPLGYALTVANLGPWPVSAVILVDYVPSVLLNPVLTPATGTYDPGTGAWTGLDLGPGSSATISLTGTLDPAASGLLVNTARVWPELGVTDPVVGNDEATDTDVIGSGLPELAHASIVSSPRWVAGHYGFYRLSQRPRSSYEIVVDGTTGDLGGVFVPFQLDRVAPDLTTVLQVAPLGPGWSRSLRWANAGGTGVDGEAVRVYGVCGPTCDPEDAYRLRAYDTTFAISRFNNAGSQLTVVVLENTTASSVGGTLWFWSPSGALLASHAFAGLAPRASLVLNTSTIPGLAGQSGSITVSHDAGYGGLQGKAVAVEPTTGFTFDSPLTPRPR